MTIEQDAAPETEQEATAFYLLVECDTCEEDIHYGVCVTTMTHRGLPVIPYDMASQTSFVCPNCDATAWTGDFQDLVEWEEGTLPKDDEDED